MALTLNDLIDPEPAAPAGGLGLARYQAVMKPQASTAAASPIERYKQIQQEKPETPIERYRRMQPQTAAAVQAPERMPTDAAGVERAPGAGHPATEFAARGLAAVPGAVPGVQAERPSAREQFRAMQPKPRETVQTQPGGPSPADIIKAKYAGDLEAGWNVGVKSMQSLGAGAIGALGQAVGSDSMRAWGVGHMQRLEREMQPWMAGRPTKLEDIKGVGDAADWAQFTVAQVAPSILESIGAVLVGGALGSAAAPGAGSAVGAIGGAAAKGAVKGALSKYLAKATSEGMLRGATREAAEQAAKRTVGAQAGAAIGMFGSSYLQGVGDVYGETLDENGRGDLLSSFALAVPYAALDSVVEMGVLGKIAKGSPGEEALKRYTRAILGTAVKEGSTEAAQEALVLLAGVKNDQEYSSEEALSRLGNGFAAGFLAGGAMGAPAGRAQREQTGFGELVVDVLPGGEDPVNGMARPELRTALTDPSMPDPVRARAFAAVTAALEGLDPVMGAAFKDVAAEALARRTTAVPTDAFMTAMTGGRRAGEAAADAAGVDADGLADRGAGAGPGPEGFESTALAEQARAAREAQWADEDAARMAGPAGAGAPVQDEADPAPTLGQLAAALKPGDIAWAPEPLDSQMVEGRGGLWTREVQRSADGAWVLERAITPDGELARERVQTFEGWAQNKRAGIDWAEEDAQAQMQRWRAENPDAPEPKEMADRLSTLRAQRAWLDGVERAGKTAPVGEEAAEIQGRQAELYRKALAGERVPKVVAEAPETAWLRERFAGAEEAPTAEAIGAALREYQPDGGQADEFGQSGAGSGSGSVGAVGDIIDGGLRDGGLRDGSADRGGALPDDEAEALAPGAQGLPREQAEGQGAAEPAELLTPERPAFVPTHVLSDGTPVTAVEGESNVYRDATGIEIEDDYAELVQQPLGAAEPAGAGAREPGALAEAAAEAAEPGAERGAAEPAGAGGRAVGAGEPVSGADDAPALTPEATQVLKAVEEGGLPFAKTRNLERIAAENGVEVTPETTPGQIVAGLRERAGEPLSNPEELDQSPNPHAPGTLAHDLEQAARAADAEAAAADPASAWEATGARTTESVKQRIQWLRQAGLRGAGLGEKAWGEMTPEQQEKLAPVLAGVETASDLRSPEAQAAEPEAPPRKPISDDPSIVARYPNTEDGVEGRVVQRPDGQFASVLWDNDSENPADVTVFKAQADADAYARKSAGFTEQPSENSGTLAPGAVAEGVADDGAGQVVGAVSGDQARAVDATPGSGEQPGAGIQPQGMAEAGAATPGPDVAVAESAGDAAGELRSGGVDTDAAGEARIAGRYAALFGETYGAERAISPERARKQAAELARAIREKDAYALGVGGQNLVDSKASPVARRIFEEETGIALPKQRSTSWKAIRAWAGVSDAQDQMHEAERSVERERKRLSESRTLSNGVQWVDEQVSAGFEELVQDGGKWFLRNPKTRMQHNLTAMKGAAEARPYIRSVIALRQAEKLVEQEAADAPAQNPEVRAAGQSPSAAAGATVPATGSAAAADAGQDAGAVAAPVVATASVESEAAAQPPKSVSAATKARQERLEYAKQRPAKTADQPTINDATPSAETETAPSPDAEAATDQPTVAASAPTTDEIVDKAIDEELDALFGPTEAANDPPKSAYNVGDKVTYRVMLGSNNDPVVEAAITRIWRGNDGTEYVDLSTGHKSIEATSARLSVAKRPEAAEEAAPKAKPAEPQPAPRTAAEAGASAAKNAAMGLKEIADGLIALFGTPGKLSSGLTFDEKTYAKAKPLFAAGVQHFAQAGADVAEMVKALVRDLVENHGLTRDAVENMRPYIKRFVEDQQRDDFAAMQADGARGATLKAESQQEPVDGRPNVRAGDSQAQSGDRRDGVGDRRPARAGDDRLLAGASAEDDGAAGAAGDLGGVRARDGDESVERGAAEPAGGDVLDGRRGAGRAGVDADDAGGRGSRADGRQRGGGKPAAGAAAADARGAEDGASESVSKPETAPEPEPAPKQAEDLAARAENYHIADPSALFGGTPKRRFAKNRAAIEIYRTLQEDGRAPTAEERDALAAYIGWGSFGQELFQGSWDRPLYKDGWRAENDWLREHLSESEWKAAQASIRNAHYTDPPTVQAMWALAERMGFQGGRVLEPAMAIGNFYGLMPLGLKARSQLTGIELDELSAGMAKLLYPQANIQQKPYQESQTPDGFYDLVIGNWPFDKQGPADRRYNRLAPSLHDYFFLKAVDQVRPGGLVMGITSRYSLDQVAKPVRLALAKKADLVAAFRLPSGAFEEYAGTKVVTDIVILRKREAENTEPAAAGWIESVDHPTPSGESVKVNEYFAAHPEHVLGTIDFGSGTTYGRAGLIVTRPDDLAARLQALPERVPAGAYLERQATQAARYITNHTQERTNAVTIGPDGELYVVQGEHLAALDDVEAYRLKDAKKTAQRETELKALVGLRKAYGALLDAERDGAKDTEAKRKALKTQYDAFVRAHGPINQSYGLRLLVKVHDPFYPALAGLEVERGGAWAPMAVLERPVMRRREAPERPSVRDAYVFARNQGMAIDMAGIAERAGVAEAEAAKTLLDSGAVFRIPGGGYAPSDVYLSGNVRRKLREAKAAAGQGEDMARNIEALEEVIPPDVPYFNIEAQLGAQWIAPEHYRAFVAEAVLGRADSAGITAEWRINRWVVKVPEGADATPEALRWRDVTAYGEPLVREDGSPVLNADGLPALEVRDSGRVPLRRLLETAFNNGVMTFKGRDSDGNEYTRAEFSAAANERAGQLREAFQDWVWKAPERKVALERDYNEIMNAVAAPRFDGSFLSFDGMALARGEDPFSLRQHQSNAIWRGLVQGSGLYAHEVGTGKTLTIGGIAVESRRFGLARKPVILAHNANSASVAAEIQAMYPGAKVLYVNNLEPKRVKITLQQIANDDWDAVVLPHSLIDRLTLTQKTLMSLAQEEIALLEQEFFEAAEEDGVDVNRVNLDDPDSIKNIRSVTAKELAKARLAIITNIQKQAERASREDAITFEDLGIDMLIVDEAHLFKKPPLTTRMKMRGLQKQTSARSLALKFLSDYVKRENAGRGVHLFTGTPITNTLAETFHMQRYVMDGDMARDGIEHWDAWFNTFAAGVSDVEYTATGDYKPVTKLAGFVNVAELRRMMSPYMDVVFADEMPEFKPRETASGKTLADTLTETEREELLNGRQESPIGRPYKKIVMDVAPMSPAQAEAQRALKQLAREWESAQPKQRLDWMKSGDPHSPILVEGNAAKMGLDARLLHPHLPDHPDSKVARAVRNVLRHYKDEPQATQVVFVDKGYSDTRTVGGVRQAGFNLVKALTAELEAGGIPAREIAVVAGGTTPEKKLAIAEAMNAGTIRVVIGQTETLGTGVNMQRNLRAMHHLDAPWMPGELEQRNGRGWRQGNAWNTVLEYRYITEQVDGRRWQVLAVKDRFIKAFLHADEDVRVIEGDSASDDGGGLSETLSEAVGDPRLLLRQKLKADVEKLQRKERAHTQGLVDAKDKVASIERRTPEAEQAAARLDADAERYRDARDAAEAAQDEAYRDALGAYLDGLDLRLSTSEREAVVARGWGNGQTDRDLAKRVRDAVKAAEEAGRMRPERATTRPFAASLLNDTFTTREPFTNALKTLAQRMPQQERGWQAVGDVFGFTLEAEPSTRRGEVELRLVSQVDPQRTYRLYANTPSAVTLEDELRALERRASEQRRFIREWQADLPKLKAIAKTPFARQADLDRKQQRLSEIEADMALNPQPAPSWLRHGAPLETEVFLGGKPLVVEGHQWAHDGYFVLTTDGTDAQRVPYLDLRDSNGDRLFEERAFEAPEGNASGAAPVSKAVVVPRSGREAEQDPAALAMDSEGGGQAVRFSRADGTPSGGPGAALSPALQRTLRRMLARGERGAKGGLVMLRGAPAEQLAQFEKATGRAPSAGMARSIRNGNVQGMFDPESGLLFVAGDLDAETTVAVLLHEATHGQRRPALDARVAALLDGDVSVPKETRAFLDRVQARMARVGESGAQGEALAYMVEAAALEGMQAGFSAIDGAFLSWVDGTLGQPIGDLLRRLVAQLRAWALNMGLPMNPAVDDLLALARGDLKRAARGQVVTEVDGARVFETAPVFSRSGPKPSDAVLIDGREVFGELTAEVAGQAVRQTGTVLTPAPIKLLNGKHEGSHRGYGLAHIEVEHGPEIRALGLSAERFVGETLAGATQIWKSGNRLVLARTGRRSSASVIELVQEYGYYSVVTAFPVTNRFKTFGDLAWRGRALAGYTRIQAKDLDSPRAPLTDQQRTSPPEPLSGKDALHPPLETLRGQPGDTKIGVADAESKSGADLDPDIRYSLAESTDRGGSPLGGGKALQDSIKAFLEEPGALARDKWTEALPTLLGAVTLRQLGDLGEVRLPGINAYNAVRQRMETRRNAMVEESGQFAEEVWQRWAGKRENKAEAAELNDFIHRTTLDQVDPDRYETLKITVQLGPGSMFKRVREATQANVDELNKRARLLVRSKKLEDKGLAPHYQAAAKQLALAVRAEKRRLAKLPELAKRWAALSDGQVFRKEDGAAYASEADAQRAIDTRKDLQGKVLYAEQVEGGWVIQEAGAKQIYRRARDLYKQRGDEMMEALIARVAESRALDEVNKRALAAKIRAEFEQTMDEKGNPRVGPYFPLQRFGRFYTAARRFPTGEARTFRKMDGGAFASESAARSAIGRRADLREVDVKPVELKDGSGWVLEELGEPGFWMYEDTTEQRRDAMRLQAEGWTSLKQGLTQEAGKQGAEAVSEGFMAQAVKQLQDRGATDEADMLYQMYLQTLNQMSIRKHFIHRKGTAGYSDNALRSFGWNMTRLAHQVAKLEHVPALERMLGDIEEGKKARRSATPDADTTVEDAYFQELQKRHQWVVSPDNASWTNFTSALGFFWYLGVTPGAALVNLSQTPIVALPTLAARFRWGPSARALGQAAVDVMRGFNPTVVKGFMTGTPRPSQAANLSADEQAAFDAWSVSGVRDRTRAHNLAGIGDTDAFWNGPTFNKGMAIVSSLFHAGEVVNRDVTLLAGYRLARKAGQSHAAAVKVAEEMTWESHFDYSNANRARAMQGNWAKVFLMFRSYSQHVTYFMWRNLYQWTKGESKAVRAEARTKFLGLMGMTGLFAGSAGLPLVGVGFAMANVMAALFGDDDEPWDAETQWRSWLAGTFPRTVGDILDRGVANTATGLDWSTRVSLRELWFRDPNRDLDGAGMYQHIVEQVLGPIGGIAGSPFTAADMIADGHWDRAAEAMTPKFLRDALKAGRYAEEGVQTLRGDPVLESLSPYALIWTAMGMQPDALRVQRDRNNTVKRYEGEILERRSRLMTAAALALIHGDREGLANVTPKIERFNAAQPTIPITMRSLRTSVRNRIRYSEEAEGGIVVNRRLGHLREVAGFGS